MHNFTFPIFLLGISENQIPGDMAEFCPFTVAADMSNQEAANLAFSHYHQEQSTANLWFQTLEEFFPTDEQNLERLRLQDDLEISIGHVFPFVHSRLGYRNQQQQQQPTTSDCYDDWRVASQEISDLVNQVNHQEDHCNGDNDLPEIGLVGEEVEISKERSQGKARSNSF